MSTGTTGAIRGGMAYVQAYLDDNPLTQGLSKLQSKLKTWQSSLSRMGAGAYGGELPEPFAALARFAQSPAGAFTALLGAAKYTADSREEMLKMSEATGVGVEKLSAFAYAARRADVSNQALAAGLKKMQSKEFQMMLQGAGGKAAAGKGDLLGLGRGGDAVDQLRAFMKATENMSAGDRVGLAKKYGISELIPLLNIGIEELDAFTARAKELGLVLTEADAKAGDNFNMALRDLHEVLMSSVKSIGGALVPMITGLTNAIVPVVVAVRDWIKDHKALTIGIFAATGAIVAGGIALKGMAIVTGLASAAIGIFKGIFAVASGVVSIFNGVLAITQALMGSAALPFLLVGAAIVGVIGYIGYCGGAFSNMGKQWKGFSEDTSSSISAISNAISKGDFTAAWDVVTAYFSTEWQRLKNTLSEIWEGFRHYFTDVYYGIMSGWNNACASMASTWEKTLAAMKSYWASWKEGMGSFFTRFFQDKENEDKTARMQRAANAARAKAQKEHPELGLQDISQDRPEGVNAALHSDMQRERDAAGKARDANLSAIEKARRDEENRIGAADNAADRARKARLAAAEAELQKKRDALGAAQAAANVPGKDLAGGPKGEKAFAAAQASELRGTFSGAAAGMLGGGIGEDIKRAAIAGENQWDIARKAYDLQMEQFYQAEAAAKEKDVF